MLQYLARIFTKRIRVIITCILIICIILTGYSGFDTQKSKQDLVPNTDHSLVKTTQAKESDVALVKNGKAASIYIDSTGADYDGISLVAKSFAEDVKLVTGQEPKIVTKSDKLSGTIVIAGSIGNNSVIDSLITKGKINVKSIQGKRECYKIQLIDKPMTGVEKAIVVVGSDKRGTIYGVYHISELMGVSPWVYWGDVLPKKQKEITFTKKELNTTSKEPSVKYRGIFLNDEWPSLGNWTNNKFGGFNEKFYDKVFELILRLKGNYLWPAMWSSNFSEDGLRFNTANAAHADAYGIVMGTSHHEPMYRAGVEWQRIYKKYGTSNLWNFAKNTNAITKFWEDGVIRNKNYESVITMGMRGEADSALEGSDEQNIKLLKDIILTQKGLLKKHKLEDAPQCLTLYSEVTRFWHGTKTYEGLSDWDVLDDVTIILAEDNHGNVRTLPPKEERDRKGGWGMYYHFDLHGAPRAFEWVNTVPIAKIWEQMSMSYDYGVDEIWVVNVGDLKPMELPISYFLDLAYDFDTWGTKGMNKTEDYTRQWVAKQYGSAIDKSAVNGIAEVLTAYTRMNGSRKPEITYSTTYSIVNDNEAQRVLKEAFDIEKNAKKYYDLMPKEYKDSYYQLVYYPAVASANVKKMQIFAGLNEYYYKQKSVLANSYAALVEECIKTDKQMQYYYNKTMSAGKWDGMMSSEHIGYTAWDGKGKYPTINYITPANDYSMIVSVEGSDQAYISGKTKLPSFTNLGKEAYWITISNGGNTQFDYNLTTNVDWIKVSKTKGSVTSGNVIAVTVDWDKVSKTSEGVITIKAENDKVEVLVKAEVIDTKGLEDMTFVKTHNVVAIEAEHTAGNVAKSGISWKVIDKLGRSLSSVKMYPTDISFKKAEEAPYLEYKVYLDEEAEYTLTAYTAPTNNLFKDSRLRYGISFDKETPVIADSIHPDFDGANISNSHWTNGVMNNIHTSTTTHKLKKGAHTLRFYGIDAGVVLQKLVLSKGTLPASYFGPQESYYIGKKVIQQEVISYEPQGIYTLLSKINADEIKVDAKNYATQTVVPAKGKYKLSLQGTVTQDAVIDVMVGNVPINSIQWKAGESVVSTTESYLINQGVAKLTVKVRSGDVKITNIIFELPDTSVYYPVSIKASSSAEGTDGVNVLDKVKATIWKPSQSDTKPWVELQFDKAYYFDHFVINGLVEGVSSYEVQVSDSGDKWTTAYKGTKLETGKEVYMQGTEKIQGKKLRIVFTGLSSAPEISEIVINPYINWAMEDTNTTVQVTKESNIDKKTIIDGDRINPGWITEQAQTVTIQFGKERTIDSVNVIGIQETVKNGGAGVIPTAEMTSGFVQRQYKVFYKNKNNQWIEAVDYMTAPDGKDTEPTRKVINKISLGEPISTTSIKVEIGTSYWIRLIELEAVENYKIKAQ